MPFPSLTRASTIMRHNIRAKVSPERNTCIVFPSEELRDDWDHGEYHAGSTEPWTIQAATALMSANFSKTVLELGCYRGLTSEWFCHTLDAVGETVFHGVDLWEDVIEAARTRLERCHFENVAWTIYQGDSIAFLKQCEPETYDFVWLDDDHTATHVSEELGLLLNPLKPLMRPRGIICMHDVVGRFDLGPICERFHGYVLNLPCIHAAGGIGIIQVADDE